MRKNKYRLLVDFDVDPIYEYIPIHRKGKRRVLKRLSGAAFKKSKSEALSAFMDTYFERMFSVGFVKHYRGRIPFDGGMKDKMEIEMMENSGIRYIGYKRKD